MNYKIGLVGLPNVGKSSLFSFFTKKSAFIANYPFATIEPSTGIIEMFDQRLEKLDQHWKSKKITSWISELIDIAGLIKGASQGQGLGNSFLSHIREVDLICHVVRCFDSNEIIHVENSVDPIRDYQIIQSELILSDIQQIDKKLQRNKIKSEDDRKEISLLEKIRKELVQEIPVNQLNLSSEEKKIIKGYNFLSGKPAIIVANYSGFKEELKGIEKYCQQQQQIPFFPYALKVESEIADLSPNEREELGYNSTNLSLFADKVKEALELKSFLTVGKDEIRNWTTIESANSRECAGTIHSDLKKNFTWAEIYNYQDWIEWTEKLGKNPNDFSSQSSKVIKRNADYLVKEGDICYFL